LLPHKSASFFSKVFLTQVTNTPPIEGLHMAATKRDRTLEQIFEKPVRADLRWNDIETVFRAVGATITEGAGSRVRVELNGVRAVFHRPHPRPETNKAAVTSVRRFLEGAGIKP
jgi:hypothetical protein